MNKFVIIPKKDEKNLFKMLPLLNLISKNYSDAEINIVHTFDLKNQLSTFPMKIKFFLVNEKDFGPVASMKLASKLDDLFNITHVLTFREEVGVLQFVKALKAKHRIGWKSLVNDVFLSESVPKIENQLSYKDFFVRAKTFQEDKKESELLINRQDSKLPENFFKDSSTTPFFFLTCDNFTEQTMVSSFCRSLVESLEENRLIVWSRNESELLKDFSQSVPNVVDASVADESQIHLYITRCLSYLTTVEWHAHMACYLGVEPYIISREAPTSISDIKYSPKWLQLSGESTLIMRDEGENQELDIDKLVNILLRENDL